MGYDEGIRGSPINEAEAKIAMAGLAFMARSLFEELKDQGFDENDAMRLVIAYLSGLAMQKP